MPIQTEEQIMNFSKDQMFDLVADIDSYSQFLPWSQVGWASRYPPWLSREALVATASPPQQLPWPWQRPGSVRRRFGLLRLLRL